MEKKYYFMTVFRELDKNYGPNGMRCWGFYEDFDSADQAVKHNATDMWETIYDYAVVEEYYAGISGYNFCRWFYKYNKETGMYDRIEEPEEVKHYASFAMG